MFNHWNIISNSQTKIQQRCANVFSRVRKLVWNLCMVVCKYMDMFFVYNMYAQHIHAYVLVFILFSTEASTFTQQKRSSWHFSHQTSDSLKAQQRGGVTQSSHGDGLNSSDFREKKPKGGGICSSCYNAFHSLALLIGQTKRKAVHRRCLSLSGDNLSCERRMCSEQQLNCHCGIIEGDRH